MARFVTLAAAKESVGSDLGRSDWLLVNQPMVDTFAAVTGDQQFIHVDQERAAATPFGGTMAHGFLTLSLLASMKPKEAIILEGADMGVNYGFGRVRFLAPVRKGKRIRASHKRLKLEDKGGGRWLTTTEVTVEIEGEEKPALIAEWLGMQYVG